LFGVKGEEGNFLLKKLSFNHTGALFFLCTYYLILFTTPLLASLAHETVSVRDNNTQERERFLEAII
jgi:hypothetical protein